VVDGIRLSASYIDYIFVINVNPEMIGMVSISTSIWITQQNYPLLSRHLQKLKFLFL
jgi:hypothetical protein